MAPDKLETWYTRFETPGLMEKAGINFCLTQDSRSATRFLPMHIGMAIARGFLRDGSAGGYHQPR